MKHPLLKVTHTMPSPPANAATPSRTLNVLDTALDQSHDVKAEVEACAEDLGSANELAKARIANGASTLPAAQALQNGLAIELRVQGCADGLQQVTDNLAHGVDEVKAVEQALNRSRAALAESEAALEASRNAERMASQLAMHDQKTGLPNRTLFDDRLAQAIASAERHGWMLAVMFLDLDRFKLVNDNHGHAAGDSVLTIVAQRLSRNARDEDTVCRNGGDEFLYLLINPKGREAVAHIASAVREAIESPIGLGALQFVITPSIGIALYPEHGMSGQTLIAHADAAMYRAKQLRSHHEFFEPPMASSVASQRQTD
jgi:diguanylate cyclase (GGDEF)-like protein